MEVLAAESKSSYTSQAHSSAPPCLQIKSARQYKRKEKSNFSEVKCTRFGDVVFKIKEVNEVALPISTLLMSCRQNTKRWVLEIVVECLRGGLGKGRAHRKLQRLNKCFSCTFLPSFLVASSLSAPFSQKRPFKLYIVCCLCSVTFSATKECLPITLILED